MAPVSVSVVMPTYNRSAMLAECLDSLAGQAYTGSWEVIVVNDGSVDDTRRTLEQRAEHFPVPLVTHHQDNRGPAVARNAGIERASGDICAFIDDDHLAPPEWLSELVAPFADSTVSATCGPVVPLSGDTRLGRHARRTAYRGPAAGNGADVESFGTGNAAVRTNALREIGGFDPAFRAVFKGIAPGGEDTDLCARLRKKGHRLVFAARAANTHQHKTGMRPVLLENFNMGASRALLHQARTGTPPSASAPVKHALRVGLSFVKLPWNVAGYRREGCALGDAMIFPVLDKVTEISRALGNAWGARRIREAIR